MHLVADRYNEEEVPEVSIVNKLKILFVNIWSLMFILFDLFYIKKKTFETGDLNLTGIYILFGYFLLI